MTHPLIIVALTVIGALLGAAFPWVFDRIPAAWLTEYGEEPEASVLEKPRIVRRWAVFGAVLLGAAGYALATLESPAVAVLTLLILFALGITAASDALYTIVPDQAVIALAALGTAVAALRGIESGGILERIGSHALGALVGAAVIFAVGFVGSRIAGRDAMGFGDVKLAAAMGAVLGFPGVMHALIIAVLIGGVVYGLLMTFSRLGRGSSAPFGPFLAAAAALMVLGSTHVNSFIRWYVSLLGGGS